MEQFTQPLSMQYITESLQQKVEERAREGGYRNPVALASCWALKWSLHCRYDDAIHEVIDRWPTPSSTHWRLVGACTDQGSSSAAAIDSRDGSQEVMMNDVSQGCTSLDLEGKHPISILTDFCNISRKQVSIEALPSAGGSMAWSATCRILSESLTYSGCGSSKKEARREAALACLEALAAQPHHAAALSRAVRGVDVAGIVSRTSAVEREALVAPSAAQPPPPAIEESNRGRILLEKLSGGRRHAAAAAAAAAPSAAALPMAVIAPARTAGPDPLSAVVRHRGDRGGLGFGGGGGGDAAALEARAREVLETFAAGEERELRFAAGLSKEERAVVHRLCRQLHLPNRSAGAGAERFLLVYKPAS